MIPERWRRIEAIFDQAVDLPPPDRAAFLQTACAGDTELRREIETLLAHDGHDAAIRDAVDAVAELVSRDYIETSEETPENSRIGPYRLTGLIGRGGMGAVYRAVRDDDEYRKEVAIKLVKRGLDSDEVLARFRRERQILASLEHPHIARLLDGGTTSDGLPYFVMEHVDDGLPITEHCDRLRLNVNERLRLFLQVCDAVRHAHRNLVVHRDLKPRNILVDRHGSPKLLDFGIAKLLHPHPGQEAEEYTRTGVRLLTPDYASPEQVRGEAVSTATDVYALGAVLYELLTGKRAQQFKGYSDSEIARVVCVEEVQKPSAVVLSSGPGGTRTRRLLSRQLGGDLDAIVMRALRKEPEHRYQSVEQLAEDIRRSLEGRPVQARQGTWRYRAAKFVSRHRLAAVAALLVGASLMAGTAATVWQARRAAEQARMARLEAERSHRRFNEVRSLARAVLVDLHEEIRELPGSTAARETLVKLALRYVDHLAREAAGDPDLQWELAEAYDRVAKVQGSPNESNLGQTGAAMESFRKSIAILDQLHRRDGRDRRAARGLYEAWDNMGSLQAHLGWTTESVRSYREAARYAELYFSLAPEEPAAITAAAQAQGALADSARRLGDLAGATAGFRRALELDLRRVKRDPSDPGGLRAIAADHGRLGLVYQQTGDLARAEEHSRKALETMLAVASSNRATLRDRDRLALAYQRMGDVHAHPRLPNTGRTAAARRYYERKHEIYRALAAADPLDAQAREELSFSFYELGTTWRLENPAKAERLYRQALSMAEEAARRDPRNRLARSFIGQVRSGLAYAVSRQGRREEAFGYARQAIAVLEKVAAEAGGPAGERHHLANAYATMAEIQAESGDAEAAARNYRAAARSVQALVEADNTGARLAFLRWRDAASRLEARRSEPPADRDAA